MFGNLNKPTFGATAPSTSFGFGAAPAANANPFGQNQLFGKPTGFGSPSTSTFGQPANNTLFSSTQAQPTNLFQNANTTFGTQPTTQTGFGTTNLFGTPQQPQQPSAGGLFTTPTAFGQPQQQQQQAKPAGFGFGAAAAQPTLFGQPAAQGAAQAAAQPQQTASMFQPAGGSGLFGGGAFGGQQQQAAAAAGTVVKFSPVTGTDTMMKGGLTQSINTKHYSITCMKEYESKSFEELRFEDYAANRKGPQQQTTGFGATPFGGPAAAAASAAPSLFGQPDASKSAFGQQATAFGQAGSAFGQTTTGFGLGAQQQQQQGGGLFGKPAGLGTPISSATTFGFGAATQNANPFGSTQAKPFGSATPLFGTNTATTQQSAFGTTNMFGKPQDGTTSAFGGAAGGFRPAASASSFAFAAPAAATQAQSPFGQPVRPAFNQQPMASFAASPFSAGAFGKPAGAATTGFGAAQPNAFGGTLGNSLLGNTANKPGLFSNTGTTGLFGNTNTGFQQNQGLSMQPQQQQQSLFPAADPNAATCWASFTTDPFGNAPHLAGLEPKSKAGPQTVSATDPKELKSLLDATKKVEASRSAKLKVVPIKSVKDNLFDGLSPKPSSTATDAAPGDYVKPSCRRLVLKHRPPSGVEGGSPGVTRTDILKLIQSPDGGGSDGGGGSEPAGKVRAAAGMALQFDGAGKDRSCHAGFDQNNSSPFAVITNIEDDSVTEAQTEPQPHGISWANTEYYTLPSMEELSKYVDENGSCLVKGFTVGRKGYGNVYFPDEIDISGLNIEEIVFFRYREINVYPDDTKKPPVGQGLNRRAQVTLDNVYPRRPGTNTLIKETNELLQMNFAEKLRKVTENKNAKFVDYRPETGSWVFKVEHFSRYGFDDSDEEEQPASGAQQAANQKITPAAEPAALGVRAQKPAESLPVKGLGKSPDRPADSGDDVFRVGKVVKGDEVEVEGGELFGGDDDLLQHSMYVDDVSEDDYRTIPADVPMHLGYGLFESNKNIQVMKSTLFDDGMSDGGSSHVSIIRQYLDIPEDVPKLPAVSEEPARRRRGVLRPKVEKVYNFAASEVSSGLIPNRSYLDMGVFKGKSFRAGWSKGFNFFSLNSKRGEIDGQLASNTIACGSLEKFDPLKDCLNDSLEIVLEESSFVIDDNQIPTFRILKGNSYLEKQTRLFSDRLSKNNNKETRYLYSIWTLADALWGSHEETFSNRRHLLSEWLRTNCNPFSAPTTTSEPHDDLFDHLTVFAVRDAADAAMQRRCPRLALLIGQLELAARPKALLQEQLEGWYRSAAAEHFGADMKRVYLLLAGVAVREEVNVFAGIDWKRAFGMHLWYISPAGAPIDVAIDLYRKSFEEYGYAERPNPPHRPAHADDCPFDVLYHMLALYQTRIHRLSAVLNPATHTEDPLDYRLSWLLLQLFLSLDVGLVDASSEETKLCTSLANQLEASGEWEHAVFVLLHLRDNIAKRALVVGVLGRNLSPDADAAALASERRLVGRMRVPAQWVHAVKGEKTMLCQRYFEAFNHFALARDYVRANDILVRHLLPGLFINEQYDTLGFLIDAVREGAQSIARWSYEAGLYSDFLELQERFVSFKEDDVLRIQAALHSISERLAGCPADTDQQRVCAAEMSKRCATVYREVCDRCRRACSFAKSYADFVERLAMPPDFKQIEALHLVNRPQCFG